MKLNLLLYKSTFFLILIFNSNFCFSQSFNENFLGANRTELYLDDLIGKKVGIVGNHTSLIYNKGKYIHLVDSLLSTNIDVKKIFFSLDFKIKFIIMFRERRLFFTK